MKKKYQYLIAGLIVLAVAVIGAFYLNSNSANSPAVNQPNNEAGQADKISELNKQTLATGVVTAVDGNKINFTVGKLKAVGVIRSETKITLQVKDKKGNVTLGEGKATDIVKKDKVMVSPAPIGESEYSLTEIQIVKN